MAADAPELPLNTPIPTEVAPVEVPVVEAVVQAAPEVIDPHAEPTLLEQATAEVKPEGEVVPDEKPVEVPVEVKPEDKPAEVKTEEKPAEVVVEPVALTPVEYAYELPETLTLPDDRKAEFHTVLDSFRADPTKGAQGLINLHEKAMQEYATQQQAEQNSTWVNTKKAWRTEVMADPIIGGAGYQTAIQDIARARDQFASDHKPGTPEHAADLKAFDGFLRVTGAGDHALFLRMMHRMAKFAGESRATPQDIKPAPPGKRPGTRGQILYDNSPSMKNGN